LAGNFCAKKVKNKKNEKPEKQILTNFNSTAAFIDRWLMIGKDGKKTAIGQFLPATCSQM
jgi:hypothetical protein